MELRVCENCSNSFEGFYCNRCGQKMAHRITMTHIFHDISHAFTHADKGIIRLFTQLFLRPGIVAREYIAGYKRQRYFNPFQYILILGSLAAFVAVNSHFMESSIHIVNSGNQSKRQLEFIATVTKYQTKYYNFVILLQLPFLALGSFLLYKKYRFNYAEHLTLQTFITAQATVISMATMLLVGLAGKTGAYLAITLGLLSAIYQVFAFIQFFGERSVKGVFKGIAAYLLGLAFFALVMFIVLLLAVLIMIKK